MNASLCALEELLALSEAMLDAAESGDWDRLASLEATRRALTEHLPANLTDALAGTAAARARSLLEGCQSCDARVRPLAAARLSELCVVLREG